MKGCLKSPLPSPCIARKCVAFSEEGSEEVHLADEWDRTPMEPARKLSYFDFLELREIQRSLPKANQIRDPSRKPVPEYLSKVPVGLLPLLPDSPSVDSAVSSAPASPQSPTFLFPPSPNPTQTSPPPSPAPPRTYLTHLSAAAPVPRRPKPSFTFLPLLDSPTTPHAPCSSPTDTHDDEMHDPPTPSLSLDASSRASSTSPDHLTNPPRSYPPSFDQPQSTATSYFPYFPDTPNDGTPPPQDALKPQAATPSPPTAAKGPASGGHQHPPPRPQGTTDGAMPPPGRPLNVSRSPSSPDARPPADPRRGPLFPSRICARDRRPPSPVLAPYCVARRRRAGPCPSPAMVSSPWCG